MKKILFVFGFSLVASFGTTGCQSAPPADAVRTVAKAGGCATGLALNYVDIDEAAAVVLTNIVSNIGACMPREGETVQDAVIRTSEAHVDILVARGDLTAQQGAMVVVAVRFVTKGYDLVVLWKPEIALYTELTFAALDGYSEGFLAAYRPGSKLKTCVLTTDPTTVRFFNELTKDQEYKLLLRNK